MELKLLLLLHKEFRAAFQEVTKNAVLSTNLRQKLSFRIQKTNYPCKLPKNNIYQIGYT